MGSALFPFPERPCKVSFRRGRWRRDLMAKATLSVVAAALLILVAAATASAQITTGTVAGTIKDAQGAVVPGATVVLISEARGTRSAAVATSGTGDFVFPNVTPDVYTVEVTMDGRPEEPRAREG